MANTQINAHGYMDNRKRLTTCPRAFFSATTTNNSTKIFFIQTAQIGQIFSVKKTKSKNQKKPWSDKQTKAKKKPQTRTNSGLKAHQQKFYFGLLFLIYQVKERTEPETEIGNEK